jgi:hypothetical protein
VVIVFVVSRQLAVVSPLSEKLRVDVLPNGDEDALATTVGAVVSKAIARCLVDGASDAHEAVPTRSVEHVPTSQSTHQFSVLEALCANGALASLIVENWRCFFTGCRGRAFKEIPSSTLTHSSINFLLHATCRGEDG